MSGLMLVVVLAVAFVVGFGVGAVVVDLWWAGIRDRERW